MSSHRLDHQGHVIEVRLVDGSVEIRNDGDVVASKPQDHLITELPFEGNEGDEKGKIVVRSLRRGRIGSCSLVIPHPGRRPERISFEPPGDGWARKRYDFEVRHPKIYASRHVVIALIQTLIAIVGINLAINWFPWHLIPFPDIDLPRLPRPNLPDLPLPDVSLPDVTMPAWVRSILESRKYWLPLLIAISIAATELRRRKKRQQAADAARDEEATNGTYRES
jgi:hypothetical protein